MKLLAAGRRLLVSKRRQALAAGALFTSGDNARGARAATTLAPRGHMTPMIEELVRRKGYNAVTSFVDANVARGLGATVAFSDPERSITYAELQVRTCQFARQLKALGLRQEERIVLLLFDTVDFPVAFWGAVRAGVVAVPVNVFLNAEQYAYLLADSRAAGLVVAGPLARAVLPAIESAPHLRTVILAGAPAEDKISFANLDVHRFEDLLRGETAPFTAATVSDEPALWLYTSGSTGHPKAVKHVHSSLMATAKLFGQGVLGIREDDVVFSAAKLFFAYGLGNAMSFPLSVGASAVLSPERPTPDGILAIMRRYNPTLLYAVPALYTGLLAHKDIGPGAGSNRLRLCISAGEALPASVGQRWRSAVGVDVLDGIGCTEMLQTFISNRPGDVRYGSSGKPVPGYDVTILDETGKEAAEGVIGELAVRGPSSAEGYWNQLAKSRRTFVGEWTYTGDKYRRDADGYYYYCGRNDDMFKVNGQWVSPFEVEEALIAHEAVLEAAVIGKEDADGLTKPKAFIVLQDGFAAGDSLIEALKRQVRERAGAWKYPRWIAVRAALPKTATGKIQRFKLRQEELAGPDG
jgi:4-hydroxybenzoate-CoA ligase